MKKPILAQYSHPFTAINTDIRKMCNRETHYYGKSEKWKKTQVTHQEGSKEEKKYVLYITSQRDVYDFDPHIFHKHNPGRQKLKHNSNLTGTS